MFYQTGGPPPDSYGTRGYYDDQYNQAQGPPPPNYPPGPRGDNFGPPGRSAGQYREQSYGNSQGYDGRRSPPPPMSDNSDNYPYQRDSYRGTGNTGYSSLPLSGNYHSSPPGNPSPHGGSNAPPPSNYRDYGTGEYRSGGYDYNNSGPPSRVAQYGGSGPSQSNYSRETDYYSDSHSDYSSRGPPPPHRQGSPPFSHQSVNYSKGISSSPSDTGPSQMSGSKGTLGENRYYGVPSHQSPQHGSRRESRFTSGSSYVSSEPSQNFSSTSSTSSHMKTGYGSIPTTGELSSRNNSNTGGRNFTSPHQQSSYSMPSFSTGYGGSSVTSLSPQSNHQHRPGSNTSSGGSGSASSRQPTSTGYVPTQSYTKPGPPF